MGIFKRTFIRVRKLRQAYNSLKYWEWTLDSTGAMILAQTGGTSTDFGLKIVPTVVGQYVKAVYIDADVGSALVVSGQGVFRVDLDRPVTTPLTAWDGNPDTVSWFMYNNRGANTTARGGARAIYAQSRNRLSMSWMRGIDLNVRCDDVGTMNELWGYMVRMEIYGTVSDLVIGMDINMSQEGAKATEEYGLRIRNSNASATANPYNDAAIKIQRDHVNNTGFNYAIDALGATYNPIRTAFIRAHDDGTVCADTGDKTGGGANGWITVVVGTATRYIQLYA